MPPLFNRDENGVSPAFSKDRKQDELNKHASQLHSFLIIILSSLIVVHLRIASCVRRLCPQFFGNLSDFGWREKLRCPIESIIALSFSIEVIFCQLRKDTKPCCLFEQVEVRSR